MPVTREKAQLMSASEIDRTLVRLAHEVLEKTADLDLFPFGITDGFQLFTKLGHFSHFTLFLGGLINRL